MKSILMALVSTVCFSQICLAGDGNAKLNAILMNEMKFAALKTYGALAWSSGLPLQNPTVSQICAKAGDAHGLYIFVDRFNYLMGFPAIGRNDTPKLIGSISGTLEEMLNECQKPSPDLNSLKTRYYDVFRDASVLSDLLGQPKI